MNIQGVTSTMMDQFQYMQTAQPPAGPESEQTMSAAEFQAAASVQVLDMAQNAFEDAAAQLLSSMTSAMTGVGQSVDMTV